MVNERRGETAAELEEVVDAAELVPVEDDEALAGVVPDEVGLVAGRELAVLIYLS